MKTLWLVLALLAPAQSLDQAVRDRIQRVRTPEGSALFQAISDVGRPVTVGTSLILIALLDRTAGPATVLHAVLALIPANLAVEGLKRATQRARPDGSRKPSNTAFPSSHAANAAAIALVFARRWRRLAPALFAFALAVGWSRMYLDRHWLSDVVVGLTIGALSAWGVAEWSKRRQARSGSGPNLA